MKIPTLNEDMTLNVLPSAFDKTRTKRRKALDKVHSGTRREDFCVSIVLVEKAGLSSPEIGEALFSTFWDIWANVVEVPPTYSSYCKVLIASESQI